MNPPFDEIHHMVKKLKDDSANGIVIVPGWREESWWDKLQDIAVKQMKLPATFGLFLKEGTTAMPAPQWETWAFLVDGGLSDMIYQDVNPTWVSHVAVGMAEFSEDDILTVQEVANMGEEILATIKEMKAKPWVTEESRNLASVVKTSTTAEPPHLAKLIDEYKAQVLLEFEGDVLSGILPKEPPVRGPYGLANIAIKADAHAKRQRCFQMVGERADALKQIIEEYVAIGWLEPSFSEWGAPAFVVPKKVKGEWRLTEWRLTTEVSTQ
jgi:hypothetical protein